MRSGRLALANIAGGLPALGSTVVLWNGCSSTPPVNFQFHLKGRITALKNCMEAQNSANVNSLIRVQACNNANTTTQLWEYYF